MVTPVPGMVPGAGVGPGDVPGRVVVLLCGPPGAGKTTAARASGLTVYDRDDPQWAGEGDFTDALRQIGRDRTARAVVIRSGATSSARARAASLIFPTHTFVLMADKVELTRRVAQRGREDRVRTAAGIGTWFDRFDRADGIRDFPGWPAALAPPGLGITSEAW